MHARHDVDIDNIFLALAALSSRMGHKNMAIIEVTESTTFQSQFNINVNQEALIYFWVTPGFGLTIHPWE